MISIIIPTLNEEKYLRKTILHAMEMAEDKTNLERIVVDAGSTDDTLKSVEDLPIKTFETPAFIFKKSLSMNFGAEESRG